MKLRTLVIDDEPIALEKLKNYVQKTPFLELAAAFDNPLDAMRYLTENSVDLIFTDIEMPDLNGMEFARSITGRPAIVFTTAYRQYALESYSVRAVDYLLKPFGLADFQRAANRAAELYRSSEAPAADSPESIFIKTDTRLIRVTVSDIVYIKGYGEYLQVFVKGRANPLVTLSSFANIKQYLTPSFIQVHRSYIVNMDNVDTIERSRILVNPDTYIPVSDGFKADFNLYLENHSVGRKGSSH